MRMLLNIKFPPAEFNQAVRAGSVDQKVSRILEDIMLEAVFFTEQNGQGEQF